MSKMTSYILLAVLCGMLFFLKLGAVPLIGLDEGLYAECSREMLVSGDYIVPTCNGEQFFDKPPLAYWLQAASMAGFGVNSFGARFPSAVAAALLVLLTVYLGTRLFDWRTGSAAGFVLTTGLLTTGLARMAILDQLFALTIALALASFILSYLKLWPRWGYIGLWAGIGLSLMVKGPAGGVLVLGVVGIFLLIQRRPGEIARMLPIWGILVIAAIAAPWYIAVDRATDGAFIKEFIIHQNFQRAVGQDFHHNQPPWFYLPIVLIGIFPWSVYLPFGWLRHVKLKAKSKEASAAQFAAVWFAVIFTIFSVLTSKLPSYIFPALPGAALLIALPWARASSESVLRPLRRYSYVALVIALVIAAALQVGQQYLREPIPGLSPVLMIMSISLALGMLLGTVLLVKRYSTAAFAAICAGTAGFLGAAVVLGLPVASESLSKPMVETSRYIGKLATEDESIYSYRLSPPQPAMSFYAGRLVETKSEPAQIKAALDDHEDAIVVVEDEYRHELPAHGELVTEIKPYLIYRY